MARRSSTFVAAIIGTFGLLVAACGDDGPIVGSDLQRSDSTTSSSTSAASPDMAAEGSSSDTTPTDPTTTTGSDTTDITNEPTTTDAATSQPTSTTATATATTVATSTGSAATTTVAPGATPITTTVTTHANAPGTSTTTPVRPATPTTTPAPPTASAPTSAFAILESDLVELDPATGAVRRTIAPLFEGDGLFRDELWLSPDRSTLYFSEASEDWWLSCESSLGSVGRIDLATGATEVVAAGWSPTISPSGDRLAYVTSSLCLPDPEEPDIWVVTPADRVVVVDLASSVSIEIVSESTPASYADPAALDWVVFHPSGDLLVGTGAGDVHRVAGTTAGTVQRGSMVLGDQPGFPVAVFDGSVVMAEYRDDGSTAIVEKVLGTGAATTVWESEFFVAANGRSDGHLIIVDAAADATVTDGSLTVLAIEQFVSAVVW